MSTDAAIVALASWVKDGHPVDASAGDSHRGVSWCDSQSLRFEDGLFVLEEKGRFSGRESSTRWTRTESGLTDVLRANRLLLKLLLQACGRFGPTATVESASSSESSGVRETAGLDVILKRLEAGEHWFLLAAPSANEMMREEALVYRPRLGWRHLETDCARGVGLESVVRRLDPPRGGDDKSPRERASILIGAVLERHAGAEATPLPPELVGQLASVERQLEDAVERLRAGEWWLEEHVTAWGQLRGRGMAVSYRDDVLWGLTTQEPGRLEDRLVTAILEGRLIAFGELPAPVRRTLETWLDPAALGAAVRNDDIVVETYQPRWTSHASHLPASPAEMAAWAVSGGAPRPTLRPTAANELPGALRGSPLWTARRRDDSAREAERAMQGRRAALVREALALVGSGQALMDSRDERQGTESVRREYELIHRNGRFIFLRRSTRMRDARLYEIDERRDMVEDESDMRSILEACLEADVEWLRRVVSVAPPAPPPGPGGGV